LSFFELLLRASTLPFAQIEGLHSRKRALTHRDAVVAVVDEKQPASLLRSVPRRHQQNV